MGLLDRFKKRAQDPKPAEENQRGPNSAPCADGNRRFTVLVEDVFACGTGVAVVGIVRGTIQVDDAVYILHPDGQITLSTIDGIEQQAGGQSKRLRAVTDAPAGILLSHIRDKSQVQKYAVLTSIRPQPSIDVNTKVENPYVRGMSHEYARFREDGQYLSTLIYQIAHAHYLVPVFFDRDPEPGENGRVILTKETKLAFPALAHPSEEGKSVFPVFTDWDALGQWPQVFNRQHPPQTMVFPFPDCVPLATEKNAGMVINPFSKAPIFLSVQTIGRITGLKGYQQEFVQKAEKIKQVKSKADTPFRVGVPRESGEVRLIRDAIAQFCKRSEPADAVYLLLKMDEKGERAYLCVADCTKEAAAPLFEALYREIRPFANEVPAVDFVRKADAPNLEECLTGAALVYDKHGA